MKSAQLGHALGDDRQRLDEDADVRQSRRHGNQVPFLFDEELRQKPVDPLDPALEELVGDAEVLTARAARAAAGGGAGAPHHGHHQLAALEMPNLAAEVDHLGDRLVSEDQVVGARRLLAVGEGGDLPVGAAETDLARAQEDLPGAERPGFVLFDDRHPSSPGKHRHRLHALST